MVHDLRHGDASVSAHTEPAALPEDIEEFDHYWSDTDKGNDTSQREKLNSNEEDPRDSVKLPQLVGAHGAAECSLTDAPANVNKTDGQHGDKNSPKPRKEEEARKAFDSFAGGKPFLHKTALSEVLVNAYRAAHSSSSRQAQTVVKQLLGQMKIDTTTLPVSKNENLEIVHGAPGGIDEEDQDTQHEAWLKHVRNPEHITFEEFFAGWDSWKHQ